MGPENAGARGTRACLLGDACLEAVDLGSVGHLTRHTRLGELGRRLQRPSDLRLPRRRLCSVVPQATGVRCMMKRGRGRRKGPTSLLASCRSYCLRSVSNLHARSKAGGEILAHACCTRDAKRELDRCAPLAVVGVAASRRLLPVGLLHPQTDTARAAAHGSACACAPRTHARWGSPASPCPAPVRQYARWRAPDRCLPSPALPAWRTRRHL
jgi:hypothetical protein